MGKECVRKDSYDDVLKIYLQENRLLTNEYMLCSEHNLQ